MFRVHLTVESLTVWLLILNITSSCLFVPSLSIYRCQDETVQDRAGQPHHNSTSLCAQTTYYTGKHGVSHSSKHPFYLYFNTVLYMLCRRGIKTKQFFIYLINPNKVINVIIYLKFHLTINKQTLFSPLVEPLHWPRRWFSRPDVTQDWWFALFPLKSIHKIKKSKTTQVCRSNSLRNIQYTVYTCIVYGCMTL